MEEAGAAAAVAVGNLDAHHAEREQLVDQRGRELRVLVHLADQRADFLVRELVHAVAQEPFVLGQSRQGLHPRMLSSRHRAKDRAADRRALRGNAPRVASDIPGPAAAPAAPGLSRRHESRAGRRDRHRPRRPSARRAHRRRLRTAGRRQADDDRSRALPRRRRLLGRYARSRRSARTTTRSARRRATTCASTRSCSTTTTSSAWSELRVIEPLLAFVRQLPPTDLVAVYYPLDSVTDVAFTRDREAGAEGDPRLLRPPRRLSAETSGRRGAPALSARASRNDSPPDRHVGARGAGASISADQDQGRKTIIFVSDGFTQPVDDVRDLFQAANRANVAIYPLDPRGLTMANRPHDDAGMIMNGLMQRSRRDGNARRRDRRPRHRPEERHQRRARAGDPRLARLLPDRVRVAASRRWQVSQGHGAREAAAAPRVFARTGYWAFKRGENTAIACPRRCRPCRRPCRRRSTGSPTRCVPTRTSRRNAARRMMMPAAAAPAAAPLARRADDRAWRTDERWASR